MSKTQLNDDELRKSKARAKRLQRATKRAAQHKDTWLIRRAMLEDYATIKHILNNNKLNGDSLLTLDNLWVAVQHDTNTIVGCVGTKRVANRVYLESLATLKDLHKVGIGSSLLEHAFEHTVHKGDAMIAFTMYWYAKFYKHRGFEMINAKEAKQQDAVSCVRKNLNCTALSRSYYSKRTL